MYTVDQTSSSQSLPTKPSRLRRALAWSPALGFALVSTLALALHPAAPEVGEMAVIFPPFVSEAEGFERIINAGGFVVGPTALPNIVVAYTEDPEFKNRLASAGALFFTAASGLCGLTQ